MTELLVTEKYRTDRLFFDHLSRRVYGSIAEIPGKRELDPRVLPIFLRIGYVPGNATLFRGVDCLPGGCTIRLHDSGWNVEERHRFADQPRDDSSAGRSESELAAHGAQLFRAAVSRCFGKSAPVVPLSGGMDSRAILGALLEQTEARNIATYTYGLPGTMDFEIGSRIARWAGTRHVRMDLRSFTFSEARIRQTALMSDANTEVVKPSVWTLALETFGRDVQYWSGFTGDGIGGSHFIPDRGDLDAAVAGYVEGDTRSLQFQRPYEWRSNDTWPVARETKYDDLLSRHEAVWFENHVERYTAHHIFMRGVTYAIPFMDDDLATFMLQLPAELRRGKRLFNRMLVAMYPKLFGFPTSGYGYRLSGKRLRHAAFRADNAWRKALWRVAPGQVRHPGASYIDFSHGVRERPDVRGVVCDAIGTFARRGVLDAGRVRQLLEDHLNGVRDTSALLTLLTSLELSLRALCDEEASARSSVLSAVG